MTAVAKAKAVKPERAITWRKARQEAKRRGIRVGIVGAVRVAVIAVDGALLAAAADSSSEAVAAMLRAIGGGHA